MRTALYEVQKELGGRFVDFAGWDMPVQFSGVLDEHATVRERVGLFDVSHMGEVRISGTQAVAFVDHLVTQNVRKLVPGQAVYTVMCLESGGIVDDLIVYREPEAVFLIVNASTTAKDLAHMRLMAAGFDVAITDVSADYALIAVQGPASDALLPEVVREVPGKRFTFVDTQTWDGAPVRVARTGYTGERGVEIAVAPTHADALFRALMQKGERMGCKPCGLGARDSLRLEKKLPLYGNDIDETTTPLEAQLGWVVKMDKPDFVGRAALAAAPVKRRWVGFTMEDRAIPRHGYEVRADHEVIGEVTSGTMSPVRRVGIGCAYVPLAHAAIGTPLQIIVRGEAHPARVCETPFL
jgi:aminomethyltransferase